MRARWSHAPLRVAGAQRARVQVRGGRGGGSGGARAFVCPTEAVDKCEAGCVGCKGATVECKIIQLPSTKKATGAREAAANAQTA
eukprot:2947396-Lingulodinium_polyedra.AAC.1